MKNEQIKKVKQQLQVYTCFNDKKYAKKKVHEIINALYIMKDCEIINESDFETLYTYAIQSLMCINDNKIIDD